MELIIPRKSYTKMVQYTRSVESEISGLANVEWDKEHKNLVVGEVYLLKQKVTSGATDLDDDDVHHFMVNQIKKGITRTPRLWWHSHYNFDTFFSTTDEDTIKRLRTDTFIVAICINQSGDMACKAIVSTPEKDKEIDPLPVRIVPKSSFEPTKEIKEEVARKVTMEKFEIIVPKWDGWGKKKKEKKKGKTLKRQIRWLPHTVDKTLKLMMEKKLIESFDPHFHEWVLEDPISETIYRAPMGSRSEEWLNRIDGELN